MDKFLNWKKNPMKLFIPIFLILSFLISCKNTQSRNSEIQTTENDPTENLNVQIEDFSEIDTTGIFMFPLRMGETKSRSESYGYKDMPYNNYWNIIFYNSKSKEYHLLSKQKMLISNYVTGFENDYERKYNWSNKYIFYTIRIQDFNKDSLLTQKDPEYLFVSDKEGNNLRQVSPSNYDLNRWEMTQSEIIILSATKDSNPNRIFDKEDEISIFQVDLKSNEPPKEIFSFEFKNELKKLYGRDWKRIK